MGVPTSMGELSEGALTYDERLPCEVGSIGVETNACQPVNIPPFKYNRHLQAKRWPRYMSLNNLFLSENTQWSLYSHTVSAFQRNLSIFYWAEPEARINNSTPQCWSQFLLKIFQSDLKGFCYCTCNKSKLSTLNAAVQKFGAAEDYIGHPCQCEYGW